MSLTNNNDCNWNFFWLLKKVTIIIILGTLLLSFHCLQNVRRKNCLSICARNVEKSGFHLYDFDYFLFPLRRVRFESRN